MDGQVNQIDGATNPHDVVPEDGHGPIPPRYWWLKRISVGVGVLLVALVVLRFWWGWVADRRLQAEIDRIIAAGEPFYPEDYIEDVPDELNAALLYEEAATTFQALPNREVDVLGLYSDLWRCEEHLEEIRALVELNKSVPSLIHKARSLADVNWTNLGFTNQTLKVANYGGDRAVAKFLVAIAAAQYFEDDHHALIETLRDSFAFGEALGRRPALVGGLIAMANHALALRLVEEFSSDLIIESAAMDNWPGKPATRVAVLELVEDLLAEEHHRLGLRFSAYGERTFIFSELEDRLASASLLPGMGQPLLALPFSAPFAPLLKLESVRCMKVIEEAVLATEAGLWPDTEAHFGEPDAEPTFLHVLARPFSIYPFGGLRSTYRRFLQLFYKHLAYRRMAALSLAIRLYEVEYGERPDALDRLVPALIESIPIDPFSPTGERLQYVRDDQRNIIYSVGFNGSDDGGRFDASMGPWQDAQSDFVFHLDGRPNDDSSDDESGQAVDDGEDADDQAGHAGDDDEREDQPQHRK